MKKRFSQLKLRMITKDGWDFVPLFYFIYYTYNINTNFLYEDCNIWKHTIRSYYHITIRSPNNYIGGSIFITILFSITIVSSLQRINNKFYYFINSLFLVGTVVQLAKCICDLYGIYWGRQLCRVQYYHDIYFVW